eukprot:SAG31_NODE_1_length_62978_cov_30.836130_28_plen_592_part_00
MGTVPYTSASQNLPLSGIESVVGKSIIFKAAAVGVAARCGTIYPQEDTTVLRAKFETPHVEGYVELRRSTVETMASGATILASLKSAQDSGDGAPRTARWRVGHHPCHMDASTTPIFDPRASHPNYPLTPEGIANTEEICRNGDSTLEAKIEACAVGDLTGKHGEVLVASHSDAVPATSSHTDLSVSLYPGAMGVVGRSIWIEFDDGQRDCADLKAIYGRTFSATFASGTVEFEQAAPSAPTKVTVAMEPTPASATDFTIFEHPLLTDVQDLAFGIDALNITERDCSAIGSADRSSWPITTGSYVSGTISLFGATSIFGKSVGLRDSLGATVDCATVLPHAELGMQTSALVATNIVGQVQGWVVLMQPALKPDMRVAPAPVWEENKCVDPNSGASVSFDDMDPNSCNRNLIPLGLSLDLAVSMQLHMDHMDPAAPIRAALTGYNLLARTPLDPTDEACSVPDDPVEGILYEHPSALTIGQNPTSASMTIAGIAKNFANAQWVVRSTKSSSYDYAAAGTCAAVHDGFPWLDTCGQDIRGGTGLDPNVFSCSAECAAAVMPFEHNCGSFISALEGSEQEQRNWRTISHDCTYV